MDTDPGCMELETSRTELERQVYDLRQLLEISKSLNSTLEYGILINSILDACMAQMMVSRAGLYVRKGLDSPLFCLHRTNQGFEFDHSAEYSVHEDHPAFSLFLESNDCWTPQELERMLGSLDGLDGVVSLEPSLIVPLKAKGSPLGFIILGERIGEQPFNRYERDLMMNIAALASIAIHNSFLFEMTTTDMMTKLKMKHYFYSVLMERMESAGRTGESLSLIMIDIDFFKRCNDTYGHSCGDTVLKGVAATILDCVRGNDLAARYGGEEFVVLMSGSDLEDAMGVADRIRLSVAEQRSSCEGRVIGVTISCGVASFDPSRDHSATALINRADKALYQSKQNGRNAVSAAE